MECGAWGPTERLFCCPCGACCDAAWLGVGLVCPRPEAEAKAPEITRVSRRMWVCALWAVCKMLPPGSKEHTAPRGRRQLFRVCLLKVFSTGSRHTDKLAGRKNTSEYKANN